jgi:hypothetical protein
MPLGSPDYAPLRPPGDQAPDRPRYPPPDYPPPDYPSPDRPPYEPPGYPSPDDRADRPPTRPPAELVTPVEPVSPVDRETSGRPTRRRHAGPRTPGEPESRGGALRHLFSGLLCLLFTPAAVALLTYGGNRYHRMAEQADYDHDVRGLAALGAGAVLLLIVAALGALSPIGPLLGGLACVAAAGLYLVAAEDVTGWIDDAPLAPTGVESAAVRWLALGALLAVGATLLGASLAAAIRRR